MAESAPPPTFKTTPLTNPKSTSILNTYSKFFLVDDKGIANPTKEYAKQKPESYVQLTYTHDLLTGAEKHHIVECGWITTSLPSVLSRVTGENRRPLYQRYASVYGIMEPYPHSDEFMTRYVSTPTTCYYISETCTQDKAAECVENTDNLLITIAGNKYFQSKISIKQKEKEAAARKATAAAARAAAPTQQVQDTSTLYNSQGPGEVHFRGSYRNINDLEKYPIYGGRRTQKRSKAKSKARSKSKAKAKSKAKSKARSRSRV